MVTVNGRPLSELGIVEYLRGGIPGWRAGPRVDRDAARSGGRLGPVESAVESVRERKIRILGYLADATIATRDAVLEAALDQMRGIVELGFEDQPGKYVLARLEGVDQDGVRKELAYVTGPLVVALDFVAYQPVKLSAVASVVSFSSTSSSVPVGTEPSYGDLYLFGSATNPVVTITDFRGATVATLGLAASLSSGEVYHASLSDRLLSDMNGGWDPASFVAADDEITSGRFFGFLPEWADRVSGRFPRISVSAGSGLLITRQAWKT